MRLRSLALAPAFLTSFLALAALNCGGSTNVAPEDGGTDAVAPPDPPPDADASPPGKPNPDAFGATTASKVDVLFVVDNSATMADKQKVLAASLGTLLRRVAKPGADVHAGVITSSLGTMGGDICEDTTAQNSRAHLSTIGPNDAPVTAAAKGFLAYGAGGSTDVESFVADAEKLVQGVGQQGCGLEAQLESAYRFLVQPDPWQDVKVGATNQAELIGIDDVLLAQRKAFLRPDSLVVVVMLTDEDDSSPDPRSADGQGWAFSAQQFPGSSVFRDDGKSTTAPRATSACAQNPSSADCTSCWLAATCNASDPACQKIKNDPECQKNGGYYASGEDPLNVRYHRMRQRFGIDPQFPLSRYVDGFTKLNVPNRTAEHAVSGTGGALQTIGAYQTNNANCTNPLFAAALPGSSTEELCNLPKGPRGKELVLFAVIGGAPESLATASPDWTKLLGANPTAATPAGQDPHMVQSITARPGLPAPTATRGDNGTDVVHGREWSTNGNDLQYACTFALAAPRTCVAYDSSCECNDPNRNPPLCGATLGQQLRASAYPTIRELRVVKDLGDRGIVGSICPGSTALGYEATLTRLGDVIAPRLTK